MNQTEKPKIGTAIKQVSLVVLVYVLFNVLQKLLFEHQKTVQFIQEVIHVKEKIWVILFVIVIIVFIWALLSLLFGSLYFGYQKVRYRLKNKE